MKTRNEIYQGEGAQLLRFITTYHSLQYEQILRLFSKNRESIKSLITSLVKQKRIIYDKENGLLCDRQHYLLLGIVTLLKETTGEITFGVL